MKLLDITIIKQGIEKLLDSKLDTQFAFKLIKINKMILPEIESASEVILKIKMDNEGSEDVKKLMKEAEIELLQEEVDLQLPKIKISELPDKVEGYVLEALWKIIEEDDDETTEQMV